MAGSYSTGDGASTGRQLGDGALGALAGAGRPGTEDPTENQFEELGRAMRSLSDGVASLWQLVWTGRRMADAARTLREERVRPWAVELVAYDDARSVLWHAPGPDAAEPTAHAVAAALHAGALPAPPGAVLMAVRNPRPAAGR